MAVLDQPPKDWKRPQIPARIKCQVLINQAGRCAATGQPLGLIADVEFDHRPALFERKFDTVQYDTIPPANDPKYIEAILKDAHKVRTFGLGGEKRITTAGSDAHRRAKMRRAPEKIAEFQRLVLSKPCAQKYEKRGKIAQRKNAWPKRKMPNKKP